MRFTRVGGSNFRLFERFEIEPQPGINLILGANAAGKTTVLEALYALGRGRSFRAGSPELLGPAGPEWLVQARARTPGQPELSVGLAWSAEGLQIRMDQADATLQDLVRRVPVQVLEPDSHRLLDEGPAYRRRYLDWGVFHVEHRLFPAWRRYQRALRQRNHALRRGEDRAAVEAWNAELADSGETIHACRLAHVEHLRQPLALEIEALLGPMGWSLELARGWGTDQSLAEALDTHYEQDRRLGTTARGPHRAELKLQLADRSARHQISRGQQKLLIAALLLAQAQLIRARCGVEPVLLVDDFPAELGPAFQDALLASLRRYGGQVFITSIERTPALSSIEKSAMFHVEHGVVSTASLV